MSEFIHDPQTIKLALIEMAQFSFATPLIKIFCSYANLPTVEYQNRGIIPPSTIKRHYFRADIDDPNLRLSFDLEVAPATDELRLSVYHGLKQDREYQENSWFEIYVGDVSGVWVAGRGNLCTKCINIRLPLGRISLPSIESRWLFGFLDAFSKEVSENIEQDVIDLPKYWDGQGATLED